ncbi:MAG: RNA polymerase sigma factor [Clostridia bacterium]|nr:RNA polymerase sigma factor [Clostridia bacterium]
MSLDSLASRVARHDEHAFEELYNKIRQAVYSVCLSVLKNHTSAEEIAQDTFVAVWTHSSEFKGKGYKTWILTIAKNKSLNLLKKQAREVSVDFSENEDIASYTTDFELSFTLRSALEALDEQEREIVLLRNSGMKAKEIAIYLSIPRGTVSWKYKEALEKLKKYLEGRNERA